jgi:hypothetical protein
MRGPTKAQLLLDVEFLAKRAELCGEFQADAERDYGTSANAIVRLAYSGCPVGDRLPRDGSDLDACKRMWKLLPLHRKTRRVRDAMDTAKGGHPACTVGVVSLKSIAEHPAYTADDLKVWDNLPRI